MTYLNKLIGVMATLIILVTATGCGAQTTSTPTPASTPTIVVTDTTLPPTETMPAIPTVVLAGSPTPVGSQPGKTQTSTSANPPASGSTAPDNYQYLGQNLADGKQYLPGAAISVTWSIKNTGSTTWSKTYFLRFFAGPTGSGPAAIPFGKAVAPGATLSLTAKITAPSGIGDYDTWYKLTNDQLQNFGDLDFKYTVTTAPINKIQPTATP
jgi:hypothetical protein